MRENTQGNVVPFSLSSGQLRRSAERRRRQGQVAEATELLRRVALAEDTPQSWLHLAEQLRSVACYEQASLILLRLTARDDAPCDVWMELARCQYALDRRELAIDCLYHYLQEDPYSDIADNARDMLDDLEGTDGPQEAFRLPILIRRGLNAWRAGDRKTGLKRIRRAIRMAADPVRLRITLALMFMAEGRMEAALQEIARALAAEPENPRAATMLCVILAALGKRRAARGFLQRCEAWCVTPESEEMYLAAAWTTGSPALVGEYLTARLKNTPHRIALLHPQATLCHMQGDRARAEQLWRYILRLDPDDLRARALLHWSGEAGKDEEIPPDGMLPASEVQWRMQNLIRAVTEEIPGDELTAPGSQWRQMIDWCFAVGDETLQQAVLQSISRKKTPGVCRCLRELLTDPRVAPPLRQSVMIRLAELGETSPMTMLMGQRLTVAQCTPVRQGKNSLWKQFLPSLLQETRRTGSASQLAAYAARVWAKLSTMQRMDAAGRDRYTWATAMEIRFLHESGRQEEALQRLAEAQGSQRRLLRCLAAIDEVMALQPIN